MPFLLIPNEVGQREAVVWIASVDENVDPSRLSLRCNGNDVLLDANWSRFVTRSGGHRIDYRFLRVGSLAAGTRYGFDLFLDGAHQADCRVRTLPAALLDITDRPFVVLLASCFSSSKTWSGSVGSTYMNLLRQREVDVKILCGDQVYLDDPATRFLWYTHSPSELEDILFENYSATWRQTASSIGGFQRLLQTGANYFVSDDHEFWNNAPNAATLIRDTWSANGRAAWFQSATSLLQIFQGAKSVTTFSIGNLSFFIADTRINRRADRLEFMSNNDLQLLRAWVANLTGPSVLVIGQPLFDKRAGLLGNFVDWSLPDYEQYRDFARILSATKHPIVVLTGDVHYGRIAKTRLPSMVSIYEIISSPAVLVNEKVGRKWHEAPDLFPAIDISGLVQTRIATDQNYRFTVDHFLTLSFSRHGARTRVLVETVPVRDGIAPVPIQGAEIFLPD